MTIRLIHGDCLDVLPQLRERGERFEACITDPPYHLTSITKRFGRPGAAPAQSGTDGVFQRQTAGFMGREWDGGDIAFRAETWSAVRGVLRPGAYLAAFGSTRGVHRMACAIEDAGFEIVTTLMWVFGSGKPVSHNAEKAIDRHLGQKRSVLPAGAPVKRFKTGSMSNSSGNWSKQDDQFYQPHNYVGASKESRRWQGYGTGLKPAYEPIILARVPWDGTLANNLLTHGVGALNIDACRVYPEDYDGTQEGRWPANLLHDGSDEVIAAFPDAPGQSALVRYDGTPIQGNVYGKMARTGTSCTPRGDSGSAARFFYCAKAGKEDRCGSGHPTVKPHALMQWLVRLIVPPDGRVIDPFCGTGSTGVAADALGHDVVLIEREDDYIGDAERKLQAAAPLFTNVKIERGGIDE
ncbi:MAG: DNA methyltransferase [Acetobacter aceti]